MLEKIETDFTRLLDCRYPIIGAPMFLVSNELMVSEISEAGGVGVFPALNFRPIEKYEEAIKKIKNLTRKPFGINIIVNKSNIRQKDDLKIALDLDVPFFITSLGNPAEVIKDAHRNGAKVFCDVTNLEHALKVQDLGADGVIAVGTGAGGHSGPISPVVLIPWLKETLSIPVAAAGGVTNGVTMAGMLALGASAVSVGTRFISSVEAPVVEEYKQAIVDASPEDIVMTTRVSGTPAAVINTEYVQKMEKELPWWIEQLKKNSYTKKIMTPLIHVAGMKTLENAAKGGSWKTIWSAGQSVGLIHDILPCKKIVEDMVLDYEKRINSLSGLK